MPVRTHATWWGRSRRICLHGSQHSINVSCGRPPLQHVHLEYPPQIYIHPGSRACSSAHTYALPSNGTGAADGRRRRRGLRSRAMQMWERGKERAIFRPLRSMAMGMHLLVPESRACKEGASHSPTTVHSLKSAAIRSSMISCKEGASYSPYRCSLKSAEAPFYDLSLPFPNSSSSSSLPCSLASTTGSLMPSDWRRPAEGARCRASLSS